VHSFIPFGIPHLAQLLLPPAPNTIYDCAAPDLLLSIVQHPSSKTFCSHSAHALAPLTPAHLDIVHGCIAVCILSLPQLLLPPLPPAAPGASRLLHRHVSLPISLLLLLLLLPPSAVFLVLPLALQTAATQPQDDANAPA
jgi:hypothetical protein